MNFVTVSDKKQKQNKSKTKADSKNKQNKKNKKQIYQQQNVYQRLSLTVIQIHIHLQKYFSLAQLIPPSCTTPISICH
jgi:hypothetical protein